MSDQFPIDGEEDVSHSHGQRVRRPHRIAAVAVIGLAFILPACGDSATESNESDAAVQELQERNAELEREAQEREEEAQAREDEAAAREARARRRERAARRAEREAEEPTPSAPVASSSSSGGGIVVPDVVGLDHQAAQDALQGEGLWLLDERDCTGQGRVLLWDRNWEVVSTDPPAGTPVSEDDTITLCSVKQGEQ